jgi:DHA2 family multidrug resistance protein
MAISEISRQKMAQASGLLNVIRQIGGSFGVAIFGTILTRRTIYHLATYGEQIDAYSSTFKQTIAKMQLFALQSTGGTIGQATEKAKALVVSFVSAEAFIMAIDDAFLLAGVIVILGVIPLVFLRTGRTASGGGIASNPPAQARAKGV